MTLYDGLGFEAVLDLPITVFLWLLAAGDEGSRTESARGAKGIKLF